MCGGAILSDIIAPTANRSRRVTADLLWSTDLTKNHTITGRPLMKFESGYNVETVFDGSKLGIEPHALIPIHFSTILVPSDYRFD
ncbi:hypothetical protein L2E82_49941 [Cichorium intybus]|nr:hypothetical protein L2E82_49941 [Cichorium intybus]